MYKSTWNDMSIDELRVLRHKMLNNSTFSSQRMLVLMGMVLADKMIVQGDLMVAEEELEACIMYLSKGEDVGEEEKNIRFLNVRKIRFLQFEVVAILRKKFSLNTTDLGLQISSMVDYDTAPYFSYLCYSAGAELLRSGRKEEAKHWLNSVLQVDK